jgi:hypothetical protein
MQRDRCAREMQRVAEQAATFLDNDRLFPDVAQSSGQALPPRKRGHVQHEGTSADDEATLVVGVDDALK